MEIKSCETCKFGSGNTCLNRLCRDCPMADEFRICRCAFVEDVENCPYYKKYEPTPSGNEISSEN